MGIGEARGPDRALRAAQLAIKNPLLEEVTIDGAKGVITNIVGSRDITLHEVGEAMNYIYSACPEAHVFYGHAFDDTLEDRIQITVIATGFPAVRMGLTNRQRNATGIKPRGADRRRTSTPGATPGPGEPYQETTDPTPGTKRRNLEEELQKPAFLRFKSNKLRH